ncbi:MBL fold metallo-hydrolase [Trichothermofontia sp.]
MWEIDRHCQKNGRKISQHLRSWQCACQYQWLSRRSGGFDTLGNFGGELTLLNGEVRVLFVPAIHSSAIASDGSPAIFAGNPGGFLITVKNGPTVYHTGDTDVFTDMALIPKFHPVDVMLACIGDQLQWDRSGPPKPCV